MHGTLIKKDDGKPATGMVMGQLWDSCTTATSATDVNAEYDLANNDVACFLAFLQAF
jgi:hypothetical protein